MEGNLWTSERSLSALNYTDRYVIIIIIIIITSQSRIFKNEDVSFNTYHSIKENNHAMY